MITFKCESCGVGLRVSDGQAGKRGKCPKCRADVVVPATCPTEPASSRRDTFGGSVTASAPQVSPQSSDPQATKEPQLAESASQIRQQDEQVTCDANRSEFQHGTTLRSAPLIVVSGLCALIPAVCCHIVLNGWEYLCVRNGWFGFKYTMYDGWENHPYVLSALMGLVCFVAFLALYASCHGVPEGRGLRRLVYAVSFAPACAMVFVLVFLLVVFFIVPVASLVLRPFEALGAYVAEDEIRGSPGLSRGGIPYGIGLILSLIAGVLMAVPLLACILAVCIRPIRHLTGYTRNRPGRNGHQEEASVSGDGHTTAGSSKGVSLANLHRRRVWPRQNDRHRHD
jgi:hypothetical protein